MGPNPNTALQDCDTLMLDMDGTLLDLGFDNYVWLELVPLKYAAKHGMTEQAARRKLISTMRSLQGQLGHQDVRLVAATVTSLGMLGPAAKDALPQLEGINGWGNKELKALVAAALRQIRKK